MSHESFHYDSLKEVEETKKSFFGRLSPFQFFLVSFIVLSIVFATGLGIGWVLLYCEPTTETSVPSSKTATTELSVPPTTSQARSTFTVSISRAKLMVNFASAAYCSAEKILAWNCNSCKATGLNFTPVGYLQGADQDNGYYGYDVSTKTIFVVFQGSVEIENWIADFTYTQVAYTSPNVISGALVHEGFYDIALSFWSQLNTILPALFKQLPGYHLVVTGHSLGAAIAVLIALMIRDNLGVIPEVHTFGQPRVGNLAYAEYWESRIVGQQPVWRYTDQFDPVPQLPPQSFNFHHQATEVWLKNEAGTEYVTCNSSGEDPNCQDSVASQCLNIIDHINYLNVYLGVPCS